MAQVASSPAGLIKVPVGALEYEPGSRCLLLGPVDVRLGWRELQASWYAEVMEHWESPSPESACWTNVRIIKILTDPDGMLKDVVCLTPEARPPTPKEKCSRLKVPFPRDSGKYEYLHRLVAFAFPGEATSPLGSHFRASWPPGSYGAFQSSEYQADHLPDEDLVARPGLAIAGWLDPVLPAEHEAPQCRGWGGGMVRRNGAAG